MRVLVTLALATAFLINAEFLLFAGSPEGYWTGLAEIDGDQTRLDLEFVQSNGTLSGNWSLPELGSIRVPFKSVKFDAGAEMIEGDSDFIKATASSLDNLAQDGLAAINYLKQRSDIDAKKIGIWGISQAGWVASRLSSMTADIAFMIIVSGGGVRPYDSEMYAYQTRFTHAGMTEEEKSKAITLLQQYFDYLKTGAKRTELLTSIESAKQTGWYQHVNLERIVPSDENRPNWNWVAEYDPVVDIRKMKFPVLLLFGDQDTEQPVPLAVKAWEQGLAEAKNPEFSIKIFPGANHGIRTGGQHGKENKWPKFAEGYLETQIKWLSARNAE